MTAMSGVAAMLHRQDAPPRPVAPRCLVFPRYVADAGLRQRRIEPVETLQRLVAGRAWLSRRPDDLRVALDLFARTPAYRLEFGCLDQAVARIGELG